MEEVEYMREGNMLVTSTRIEIDGQTFAVRNVGSVKVDDDGRPWLGGFVLFIGIALAMSPDSRVAGALFLAVGGWLFVQKIRTRKLILVSGGGETLALKSTNGTLVEQLRQAVAKAISTR